MSVVALPGLQGLAGTLRITPGAPPPHALQSSRQDWAARMGHGVEAARLPGLMASLFNLCSHAHRLCSQLAIGAVAPGLLPAPTGVAERLRRETALEHIRRIGLDWPRLLAPGTGPGAAAALHACPQPAQDAGDPWPALREWLRHELLHLPPADWLSAWRVGGADWLCAWSQRHAGWLPALLHAAQSADDGSPLASGTALRPHADEASLRMLDATLALRPGFALRPKWNGACAHTGPWSRLHGAADGAPLAPWALLGARLAELCRLSLDGGDATLGWGAMATGARRGLAWVEMARGLLLHQVEVDPVSRRVQACRVVAPTEWNFHPHGEVAQRLARLDPGLPEAGLARRVHLLLAAFDPCVPFRIEPIRPARAQLAEAGHA